MQAGRVPRDHEEGRRERRQPSSRAQQESLRRAAGAARARPHRRVRRLGARVEQARLRAVGRPRAERGAAAHRRSRARDRGVRPRGVLELRRRADARHRGRRSAPFMGRLVSRGGEKLAVKNGDEAAKVRGRPQRRAATASRRSRRASASASRPRRTPRASSSRTRSTASASAPSARCRSRRGSTRASISGRTAGPVGLITYMRTDSTRLSPDAVEAARDHITDKYGKTYVPAEPNVFKSKKNAQEAHEAIRPTSLELPARERAQAPEGRAVQALQADLGALRRQPDDARGLRPDERRHRGRREGQDGLRPARERSHPEVRGVARGVRQGRDPQGRDAARR